MPRIAPPVHSRGRGPPWRTVADGQIVGGKVGEPETFLPVEKRNFYILYLHFAPPLGVIQSEFRTDVLCHKTGF